MPSTPSRPSAETLLERAAALVPTLRARGPETDDLRRLPDATMAALEAAGLFHAVLPQRGGGFGHGMRELGNITRILAQGCASTAWVYSFLVVHDIHMIQRLDPRAVAEIRGDRPYGFAASSSGFLAEGSGTATPVDGGWRLSGRWPFASGVMNAGWIFILTNEQTAEGPKPLTVVVPVADLVIEDVWHFSGMKGTGSNTVAAEEVFVPSHRRLAADPAASPLPPPAERAPLEGFSALRTFDVVLPAVAVGAAEGALEVFKERVLTRAVAFRMGKQVDHPEAWARYADAASTVRLARLLWDASVELTAGLSERGEKATLEQSAHFRLASSRACQLARDAITIMVDGGGSSIYHLSHPLQRFQRDVDVLKNHSYLHWDESATTAGRALLGLEPVDPLLLY